MKTFKIILSCTLCWLLLSSTSCKKDKPLELPPETTEGRNTFGCLIDGEEFVYKWEFYIGYLPLDVYYRKPQNYFVIGVECQNENDKEAFFSFYISNPEYQTKTIDRLSFTISKNKYLEYSGVNIEKIEFTRFDTIEQIVSGRFNFTLTSENNPDVKITDGRFDVKFRTLEY